MAVHYLLCDHGADATLHDWVYYYTLENTAAIVIIPLGIVTFSICVAHTSVYTIFQKGDTPMHSLFYGSLLVDYSQVLKLLIQHKANINAKNKVCT